MFKRLLLSSAFLMAGAACLTHARVYMGAPFKSGMVLQQKANAMLWGTATPGATVTITPDWAQEPTKCVAGPDRKWRTAIPTPEANGFTAHKITITDGSKWTTTLSNVLIGEVWLSSGQSNMDMPIPVSSWSPGVLNADSIIATGDKYKGKMHYTVIPHTTNRYMQDSCSVAWNDMNTNNARSISAMSYLFATHLIDSLNIPVGIINASYGGSPVIAWIPQDVIATFGNVAMNDATYASTGIGSPAAIFNTMINPLKGYTLAGFIWYQGEANAGSTVYGYHLANMVQAWRKHFTGDKLPFYQVELTPYYYNDINGTNGAVTREQQNLARHMLPDMGLVGSNDVALDTETEQIHPSNKVPLGKRLGNMALHDVYGFDYLKVQNPEVKNISFKNGAARITFTHCEDGFNIQDDIKGFELSGSDGKMYAATGHVEGNEVVVSSSSVATPKAVNYCFRNFLKGNLKNKAGLPIIPFRSNNSVIPPVLDSEDASVQGLQGAVLFAKEKMANYTAGTETGYVEQNYWDLLNAAYNEANTLLQNNPTAEKAAPLMEKLNKYIDELDDHCVPVSEGYYYIVSAYSDFKSRQKVEKCMCSDAADTYLHWNTLKTDSTACIFKVTEAADGYWYLQNAGNNKYVGYTTSSGGKIPLKDEVATTYIKFKNFSKGQWGIVTNKQDLEFSAGSNNSGRAVSGTITTAGGTKGTASSWYLRKITDQTLIDKIETKSRIALLNEAIENCKAINKDILVGEDIGDVTKEVKDVYENAIDNAGKYTTLTADLLKERLAQLNDATKTVLAACKNVEPNVWYYIQNQNSAIAGSALYMKSPNLTGCDKWTASDDIAFWGCLNKETKEFEGNNNPFCMWRLVPIEGKDGVYALQNRATGNYLSKTLSKGYRGNSTDAQAFTFNILGHRQAEIISVDDAGNYENLPLYATTTGSAIINQEGGKNTPAAWNFVPVPEMETVELDGINNTVSIVCLPYAVNFVASPSKGYTVNTYTLASMPKEGAFGLSKQATFKAGEPFFLEIKPFSEDNGTNEDVKVIVTCPTEYVQEALTVNGVTGVLSKISRKQKGMVYFNAKNEMKTATTISVSINGQTGYIDPTQIVNQETPIDLYIGDVTGVSAVKYGNSTKGSIFSADGKLLRTNACNEDLKNMPDNIYIINGQKISK